MIKKILSLVAFLFLASAARAAGPYWNVRQSTNTPGAILDYPVYFKGEEPWIDVVAYGASTSAADNTAVFATALAAGKRIRIPAGTWLGTLSVSSSHTIVGAGIGRSIIKQPDGLNGDVVAGSGYNIVIADLSIDGNVAGNPSGDNGISFNTIYKSRIIRVATYNNKLKGVALNAPCDDVVIDNSESYSNAQDGYAFASNTIVSGQYCKNVSLINSYSHDNTLYGVGIDTPNNTYLRNVNTAIINNRFVSNGTYGIEVFGAISPSIIGNYVEGSGNHGIDLGSTSSSTFKVDGALVLANTIKNQAVGTSCIRMQSIANSRIQGNRCFDDQASPTTQYGIIWNDGNGNVISGNDVSGVSVTGIDTGSSVNQVVKDNIGQNTDFSTHTYQINLGVLQVTNASTGLSSSDGFQLEVTGGTTEARLIQKENDAMRFYTNNTERAVIDSSGRLGLGVTTPSNKLEVSGNVLATDVFVSTFSTIHCNTGNGHGSTDTAIRRFATCTTVGTDITMSSTAANGNTFTATKAGVYSMSYDDFNSGGTGVVGISVNSSARTTAIYSTTYAQGKRMVGIAPAATTAHCSITIPLAANDIVYPHDDGAQNGTTDNQIFSITRVR